MSLKRRLASLHARIADAFHAPLRRPRAGPFFEIFPRFIELVNAMPTPTVLELGSRNVTGVSQRGHFGPTIRYLGIDIHPGEGVDMVADVHRLSEVVAAGSVDAVFSISVFEHLAYPWRAVMEINRVLKPGGYLYISSHPSWPAHELPWDFWRFPVAGLAQLLIPETGFEVLAAAEGVPAKIYPLDPDPSSRGLRHGHVNLGVAILARKVADYDPDRLRWNIDVGEVLTSEYPRRS